jgi:AcrR family transcriptional regulator
VVKETIAQAADSVLEEHGIGGMTMDRVATTAGLATASLYNYFQDKDELVRFIYARLVEPFFEAIEKNAKADVPAPQKVEMILRTSAKHASERRGLVRLLADSDQRSRIRRTTHPRLTKILTGIFQRGIVEGLFRRHNPTQAAHLFAGTVTELFDLQTNGASNEEIAEFIHFLVDTVLAALSVPASEKSKRKSLSS